MQNILLVVTYKYPKCAHTPCFKFQLAANMHFSSTILQSAFSPSTSCLYTRKHFLKPRRDTRAGIPFDARCCRRYWIKVSRFAKEIISRAARPRLLPLASSFFSMCSFRLLESPRLHARRETYSIGLPFWIFSTCRVSLQTE